MSKSQRTYLITIVLSAADLEDLPGAEELADLLNDRSGNWRPGNAVMEDIGGRLISSITNGRVDPPSTRPEDRTQIVTANKQVAHLRYLGEANTICGAMPKTSPAEFLTVLDTTGPLHKCRRCPW